MAVLLLLSKGVGLLREVAVAHTFGADLVKDANTVAYYIPASFLIMLGGLNGPFHLATMGAVTRLKARGQESEVPGLLLTILGGTAALTGAIALASYLAAPALITIQAPTLMPEARVMAIEQFRIMSPLIVIGGLIGVLCGISNLRDKFANSSLTPMVSSLAVIAVLFVSHSATAIAWGTLIGAVGQLVLQAWPVLADWRDISGGRPVRPLGLTHPGFVDMMRQLVPASLSSSIGTLNAMIGSAFCASLGRGAISVFNYSNLLIQFPLGILLTAMLVPMFPRLTEAAATGDREALFGWLNRGVQAIALFCLPMTGLLIVLGHSAVQVAFQRGAFHAADTDRTALVLGIISLSIVAYATRDLFTRVFYAQNKSRIPLIVTSISLGLNLAYNSFFVRFGLPGLATSTTLVTVTNLVILGALLRADLGTLGLKPSLGTLAKALVATLPATGVAWAIARWLPAHGFLGALVQLLLASTASLGLYAAVLLVLRVPLLAAVRATRRPAPRPDPGSSFSAPGV